MISGITFIKQEHAQLADGNVACPQANIEGSDVTLLYEDQTEALAKVKFLDVACFRVGSPNDEGFFGGGSPGIINDSMYCWQDFPKLEFGYFYEVIGFDWANGFSGTEITEVMDRSLWLKFDLRHYVYFMKDGTFECLCKSWKEIEP